MKIKHLSQFKNQKADHAYFETWVNQLETLNKRSYEKFEVSTSLGKTQVYGLNSGEKQRETLVIFPGARTTSLFWDFDRGLDPLLPHYRIFLVETNGLPNLSDSATPDIRSSDYGHWAAEVFRALHLEKAFVAGASFGGLIGMKLCLVAPHLVKAVFLLNPGCLQSFSLTRRNLYLNLLPIISPKKKNVQLFLDEAIFCKPHHQISPEAETLLLDYELFALRRFKDRTQKPYFMKDELRLVENDVYLLEGDRDLLFPFQKSMDNARCLLRNLKKEILFHQVGHGIETYPKAIAEMAALMSSHKDSTHFTAAIS